MKLVHACEGMCTFGSRPFWPKAILPKAFFCLVAFDAPGFAGVGAGPLYCSSENFFLYTVPLPLVAAPPPPLLRRRASGMGRKGTRERRRQARDGGLHQVAARSGGCFAKMLFSASVVGCKQRVAAETIYHGRAKLVAFRTGHAQNGAHEEPRRRSAEAKGKGPASLSSRRGRFQGPRGTAALRGPPWLP